MEIIRVAGSPAWRWAGQHLFGVRKIQSMLGEVAAILRFIPFVHHPAM